MITSLFFNKFRGVT